MGIPLRELQQRIDSPTFALYMAHDRMSPFGEKRADLRAALTAWTVAKAGGAKSVEIDDFMPKFGQENEPEVQTPEEMLAIAMTITRLHGGTIG